MTRHHNYTNVQEIICSIADEAGCPSFIPMGAVYEEHFETEDGYEPVFYTYGGEAGRWDDKEGMQVEHTMLQLYDGRVTIDSLEDHIGHDDIYSIILALLEDGWGFRLAPKVWAREAARPHMPKG